MALVLLLLTILSISLKGVKMSKYAELANDDKIKTTKKALETNNIKVEVVDNLAKAKELVLNKIPDGSKVFTATSTTLIEAELDTPLNTKPFDSVRNEFMQYYGQEDKKIQMKQIGSTSDVTVSSVHAITEDGKLLIASATGSQLPNEAYGASKIIFVVGSQKIVTDLSDGIKRIEEYVVPLEDVRAKEAYGVGTNFSKLLVINNETDAERITVIIVKQKAGF